MKWQMDQAASAPVCMAAAMCVAAFASCVAVVQVPGEGLQPAQAFSNIADRSRALPCLVR
jgi:hypothetical protein